MQVILIWVTVLGVMIVFIVGCGSSNNSVIEEDSQEKEREATTLKIKKALAEARQLVPIIKDYLEQREQIASQKIPSAQIIKELEALDEEYEPHVYRFSEIYVLVTDTEVVELLGDWVQKEAEAIFGPLDW